MRLLDVLVFGFSGLVIAVMLAIVIAGVVPGFRKKCRFLMNWVDDHKALTEIAWAKVRRAGIPRVREKVESIAPRLKYSDPEDTDLDLHDSLKFDMLLDLLILVGVIWKGKHLDGFRELQELDLLLGEEDARQWLTTWVLGYSSWRTLLLTTDGMFLRERLKESERRELALNPEVVRALGLEQDLSVLFEEFDVLPTMERSNLKVSKFLSVRGNVTAVEMFRNFMSQ